MNPVAQSGGPEPAQEHTSIDAHKNSFLELKPMVKEEKKLEVVRLIKRPYVYTNKPVSKEIRVRLVTVAKRTLNFDPVASKRIMNFEPIASKPFTNVTIKSVSNQESGPVTSVGSLLGKHKLEQGTRVDGVTRLVRHSRGRKGNSTPTFGDESSESFDSSEEKDNGELNSLDSLIFVANLLRKNSA